MTTPTVPIETVLELRKLLQKLEAEERRLRLALQDQNYREAYRTAETTQMAAFDVKDAIRRLT